ncbi:Origin recognition complex, subunit 1 [Orobanche gracilis]
MAGTPKMKKYSLSSNRTPRGKQAISSPGHLIVPHTPQVSTPIAASLRRTLRRTSTTPQNTPVHSRRQNSPHSTLKTLKSYENASPHSATTISIIPASPQPTESRRKIKLQEKQRSVIEKKRILRNDNCRNANNKVKKRAYYKKVVFDGVEFSAGEDVYECRVCFKPAGRRIMIECGYCLNGFHLKCVKPPLKKVPEEDWICNYCEAKKSGKIVEFPEPPKGEKRTRTAREKFLLSNLWAARIESLWKEVDDTYWCRARWYIILEETAVGRQSHNLRRELYRTNDVADIEMASVIRHCYVMSPKEFSVAGNEGDDVFLFEYEYDIKWHSFKRISEIDNNDGDEGAHKDAAADDDWNSCNDSDYVSEEDMEYDDDQNQFIGPSLYNSSCSCFNSRKGRIFGLQKIGAKRIPEHVRCHKQTDLEKAKATLLLATLPKSLPYREKEMHEITTFIKGAVCDEQCLERCLYVHGVPGTGKTMSVLAVMSNLKSEVDAGSIRPYCFVEINGLKLVIYEGLSGHRVGWKKALHLLNERFLDENNCGKDMKPCFLLIDELDLLVLYNILDWPTKPNSKLIVIADSKHHGSSREVAPRISSRLGIQRLCFGPYNYQQPQEIISSRLKGIHAFKKSAIEFVSRKVAAVSGDAGRALEICRHAAELADYRAKRSQLSISNAADANLVNAEYYYVRLVHGINCRNFNSAIPDTTSVPK